MAPNSAPKPSRKSSSNHRSTLSLQRTEVKIHVYDLLPPGKISTLLWAIGSSLLHSGVVINGREYAYGGHDQPGVSGVYWTRPGEEPPGGTFRQAIVHGFSFRTAEEMDSIIQEAMQRFQGTSYNLLTMNCNHFTSYLCQQLTGRPAPSWINRAASIGVALPCVVPREWIDPPDYVTANGELLDEDVEDERSSMLRGDQRRQLRISHEVAHDEMGPTDAIPGSSSGSGRRSKEGHTRQSSRNHAPRLAKVKITDSSGRPLPPAERAPPSRGAR
ncbi:DUF862-domain-containing protein [Westerdykella ornata]|uniref:DUF862-domain-containing protein n=1 Tax=Westerdykella ornata TaxID=318751 RepID=A0A6A6JHY4_WESOR|nr:DUF862-domain-containing protein [Westerdykella ornata]KAF2276022.1 DUF862-domain-containing protein [Westerdykella ornata]